MKRNFVYRAVMLLTAVLFLTCVSSCSTDKCETTECFYGGTCNDGKCDCPAGTSGANCEIADNSKLEGLYEGTDGCDVDIYGVNVIAPTAAPTQVYLQYYIENVGGSDVELSGTVSGNSITVATQSHTIDDETFTFSGTGTVSGNTLTLTIVRSDGIDAVTCVFVGSK